MTELKHVLSDKTRQLSQALAEDAKTWRVGSRVRWTDPDEDTCSGDGTITAVTDDRIAVRKDDGGFVEALPSELTRLDVDDELEAFDAAAPVGQALARVNIERREARERSVRDQVENLIDVYGLHVIVGALAHICGDKAEHVESTWQDLHMSKAWRKASNRLATVAEALRKTKADRGN